jgi:DNA polymerase I-like protein with 3'-5' exonuclease and polymerase domains
MGIPIVLHVHDEVVSEVEESIADEVKQTMEGLMRKPPEWAAGFVLNGPCKIFTRYGK